MRILLIDTCGAEGSVAVADMGSEPAKILSATLPGRSASEKLVGAVREMMKQSHDPTQAEGGWGTHLGKLDAIAVVNGPGSFTGVRVGLSAAKGWCEALGLPLIAVSRLAVLGSMADAKPGASIAEPGASIFVALDAGRGEFYLGEYRDGDKVQEALASRDDLAGIMSASSGVEELVVCEESVALALAEFGPVVVAEPDAAAALPLAMRRMERNDFDDVASIDANYLRRTDLEIFAKTRVRSEAAGG